MAESLAQARCYGSGLKPDARFGFLASTLQSSMSRTCKLANAFLARLRRPSVRKILSAHGTDVAFPLRGGLLGRLYAAYLSLGSRLLSGATVIANSSATAEQARKYGFDRVVVVPLAADVHVSGTLSDVTGSILFSGRLIPQKGCRWFAASTKISLSKVRSETALRSRSFAF